MAKFSADTVEDFIAKSAAKWGKGEMGEAHPVPDWKYAGFKDGKIVRLEFKFSCTIEYAEDGGGKGDKNTKAAIKTIAKMAKQHEEAHKAAYDKAWKKWDGPKHAKALMAQSFDSKADAVEAMEAAFAELKSTIKDACIELHKKEGYVEVDKDEDDGSYDVRMKAAGPKGCE